MQITSPLQQGSWLKAPLLPGTWKKTQILGCCTNTITFFWRPKPLSFHKEQYLRLKIGLTNFSCFLEMIFSCFHINLIQNWIFPPLALDFLWIAYRQLFCFLETLSKLTLWSRLQTAPFSQGKPSMFYSHKGTISKQYDAVSTKLHLFLQRYF